MDKASILERHMAEFIARLAYQHLTRSNMVRDDERHEEPLIYAWPLEERVVLIIDPIRIRNLDAVATHRFQHHLATILQGRRVVILNYRGLFIQVAYWPQSHHDLISRPLDLSAQPSPTHVPIGVTAEGDLWLSITEMDAVLIGGARRMGKSNLLHNWILALLQGKQARLILFDGKAGVEFAQYAGKPRCQVINGSLGPTLGELFAVMNKRLQILKDANVTNLVDYNRGRGEGGRLEIIIPIVDELAYALQEPGVEDVLVDLIARGGAVGIHPVVATQRPSSDMITPKMKGNLVTRIAFPVPTRADSMVILDRSGAESLPKTPGRLLITHRAQVLEAQAFRASVTIVSDVPQLPSSAHLLDREQRVAFAAVRRDGWFKIRELKADTGESNEYLVALAQKWELLGYLTQVQRNERGHQLGRRVTDVLRAVLGEQENEGNQAARGEQGANEG